MRAHPRTHTHTGCKHIRHNGQFHYLLSNSMATNKRGKWQEICQSFIVERCLTKEALKTCQLFFSTSVPSTTSSLKRGPRQQTPARALTPILTPYRWHSVNTGSKSTIQRLQGENVVLNQRPALRDHLDRHKDSSMPVKCILTC